MKISESQAYVFNSKLVVPEPIWLKFEQLIVSAANFVFFFHVQIVIIFSKELLMICLL